MPESEDQTESESWQVNNSTEAVLRRQPNQTALASPPLGNTTTHNTHSVYSLHLNRLLSENKRPPERLPIIIFIF